MQKPLYPFPVRVIFCLIAAAGISACRGENRAQEKDARPAARTEGTAAEARSYIDCIADPRKEDIRLFWKDDTGGRIRSLGALDALVKARGQTLRYACNGGMYQEDGSPVGLFIADGKLMHPLNTRNASGNFYLKPNGVFYLTSAGEAAVCITEKFPAAKGVRWATQSGPMLVIDSSIHPAFKQGSENRNIRNGVGILPDGRVLFAMSTGMVSLYDFADYFRSRGCRNALYLDGFVSRTFFPEQDWEQRGGDFGVMIGVVH